MDERKFDPKKLNKLNNPERIKEFPLELILKETKISNPGVIIDLGAGTAFFSIPFARIFRNCRIYACDILDFMIDWMNSNIVSENRNIIPLKMNETQVPLEKETADLLFMVNLHHELDDPEAILRESYRLLKQNGSIAISDWRKEETEMGPSIEIRYEEETVKRQLQTAGFENIRIYRDFPNNFLILGEKGS